MKTNIALIGFMGVGKSTTGKTLADKLGKKLIEVDSIISKNANRSIPQIFQEDGEIAFREMEISAIKEISSKDNLIIDCGGGVPLNKINIDRLRKNSIIVWLFAAPEVILQRTTQDGNVRPLLQSKTELTEIRRMLRSRQPYYEAAADIKIDTSKADVETLAEQILTKVKENADFSKRE
jgi:shikimate kinase